MSEWHSLSNLKQNISNKNTKIFLGGLCIGGFFLRIFFIEWDIPTESPDTFSYLIRGINYTHWNFDQSFLNFLWPLFLSPFFRIIDSNNYLDYMNIMRIVSVVISSCTIPLVYIISKKFVEKKYALFVSAIIAFQPHIIENATLAISEPLFIVLGLLSVFFLLKKEMKFWLIGFGIAGLSFDVRLSGIITLFIMILGCAMFEESKKKLIYIIPIGVIIFTLVSFPYVIGNIENESIPFIERIDRLITTSSSLSNPHLVGVTAIYSSENAKLDIFVNAAIKEIYHLTIIGIPFLIILTPIGIAKIIRKKSTHNENFLILTIMIVLIITYFTYIESAVWRNLLFIIPFLAIVSTIGLKLIEEKIKRRISLILIIGMFIFSFIYLTDQLFVDKELILEKDEIAKLIIDKVEGKMLGDNYVHIIHNIPDISKIPLKFNENEKVSMQYHPVHSFNTFDDLLEYSEDNNIKYLIVDGEDDYRFPIFQSIFFEESKFKEKIEKIFDSKNLGYSNYHVKVFRIK